MPVNRKWPLHTLVAALQDTFPRRVGKSHPRHVLIEYVMLKDVNDTLEDAHRYSHAIESAFLMLIVYALVHFAFVLCVDACGQTLDLPVYKIS